MPKMLSPNLNEALGGYFELTANDAPDVPDQKAPEYRIRPKAEDDWISPYEWQKKYGNNRNGWERYLKEFGPEKYPEQHSGDPDISFEEWQKIFPQGHPLRNWGSWKEYLRRGEDWQEEQRGGEKWQEFDSWIIDQMMKGNKNPKREDYDKDHPRAPTEELTDQEWDELLSYLTPEERAAYDNMTRYGERAMSPADNYTRWGALRNGMQRFLQKHPELIEKWMRWDKNGKNPPKGMDDWYGW